MANKPPKTKVQYGALPLDTRGGAVRVMLVTSRETKRWVIPKGWPERKLEPHQLAAREAFEEAGLVGKVKKRSIGSYHYDKRMPDGRLVPCVVRVFRFEVQTELEAWPEKGQREHRWCTPAEAATLVSEPELAALLLALDESANLTFVK